MLRAQANGKHLCRQQCVPNNVSSFSRAFKQKKKQTNKQQTNKQTKTNKKTLESAQDGLEIIFKIKYCQSEFN